MQRTYAMFVYPGSISRVAARIMEELEKKVRADTSVFRDVFAGSGIASILMADKYPHIRIHMNDLDEYMYSFWDLVANGSTSDDRAFKRKLAQIPTVQLFHKLRLQQRHLGRLSMVTRAYHAVFFHRCTYSGMFHMGPRGGQRQHLHSITDCYNGTKLQTVYNNLVALLRGRLAVSNLDAVQFVIRFARGNDSLWFFDPPWIGRGREWYTHSMDMDEHVAFARLLTGKRLKPKSWLMIIGDHPTLAQLYYDCRIRNINVTRTGGRELGLINHSDKLIDKLR